jgi:hypothetical protein
MAQSSPSPEAPIPTSITRGSRETTIEGPITKTKWSHIPITFSVEYMNLASFPHTDTMVITIHINRWDITKVLVDNGSQVENLFLSAFKKWAMIESN